MADERTVVKAVVVDGAATDRQSVLYRHPMDELLAKAADWGYNVADIEFCRRMDEEDPLKDLRKEFCYPKKCDLPESKRFL